MSYSNSSLNSFASCMARYEHNYILHTPPCKPISPHLTFGIMAHDCLYKAGKLRDEAADGLLVPGDYQDVIPSEVLNLDLKATFGINSWEKYFTPIITQIAKYENDCVKELEELNDGPVRIERELKLQIEPARLNDLCGTSLYKEPLVGIIDLLLLTDNHAIILDYKFSSSRKTQDDFDLNSQLPLYAFFVNQLYNIPVRNIKYGYIDIPKKMSDTPAILSNGTLSRAKSANITADFYKQAVIAVHGPDDPVYNCEPGGWYYEAYCAYTFNKPAYLSMQYCDETVYKNVMQDLFNCAKMIEIMKQEKLPFLRKYDAYSCKDCEYLKACKPWLYCGGDE